MQGTRFLATTFYENTLGGWVLALAVFVLAAAGLRLLARLTLARMESFAKATRTDLDDLVAELLRKTRTLFVLLVAFWAASATLVLPPVLHARIRAILVVGFLLQAGFWGTGVVNYLIARYQRRQVDVDPGSATAVGAMAFLARMVVWSVFVLLILDNLGIDVTALITGLGIGGVAVALALQNVLSDLFASLSIVLDKPFVIGDFIIVGDLMGTVEHVGLKTTRIRSLGGEQLIFSNSDLLKSRIRNYKRMNERRILFQVGVEYDTPLERLEEIPGIIREAVERQENTRFDRSHFKGYGASSLDFETVYYMLVPDYNTYMDVQQAINLELYERFQEKGIAFAFPSRTVYLRQEGPPAATPAGA